MNEIQKNTVFVSSSGGVLDFVSDEGELLASIAVPPGRVPASDYLDLVPDGASIQLSEGLAALTPRLLSGFQDFGSQAFVSGANPDWKPTSASRHEKEMRLMLNRMAALSDRVERRAAALDTIERIPTNPQKDNVLIEDEKPAVSDHPGQLKTAENAQKTE